MDVCSHLSLPIHDVNSLHGFCKNTLVGNFSVDELSYKATKFLSIQDDIKGVSVSNSIPLPPNEKVVLKNKPVSAMKGTRSPAKQLTVKWAPDVYDPVVPCSTVVTIVIKRPRKKNGKSSKEKDNGGKSSRGSKSKGKDKKQSRKRGGELL